MAKRESLVVHAEGLMELSRVGCAPSGGSVLPKDVIRLTPSSPSRYCDISGALILEYPWRVILEQSCTNPSFFRLWWPISHGACNSEFVDSGINNARLPVRCVVS